MKIKCRKYNLNISIMMILISIAFIAFRNCCLQRNIFSSLSCESKVLYGLMLDRMSLSLKNKWFDEQNRAYIIFTIEDVMELLNCKSQKAVKIMKELDAEDGIGLIEKIRQGIWKA